jgi:hypothetical protein
LLLASLPVRPRPIPALTVVATMPTMSEMRPP